LILNKYANRWNSDINLFWKKIKIKDSFRNNSINFIRERIK
jgi:hypothetical protein